jgi:hypothetical protein
LRSVDVRAGEQVDHEDHSKEQPEEDDDGHYSGPTAAQKEATRVTKAARASRPRPTRTKSEDSI